MYRVIITLQGGGHGLSNAAKDCENRGGRPSTDYTATCSDSVGIAAP